MSTSPVTPVNSGSMNQSMESLPLPSTPIGNSMIIIGVFLASVCIGTVLGNLLVVLAIGLVKKLRTPSNFLIVSLAVSDLLVGLLVIPLATLNEVRGYWPLGEGMCDMYISFDVLMCTASILNLCAISIDRYLAITRPLQYAAKRTPKRMMLMILLVWLFSALISIPPMFGFKEPFVPGVCQYSSNMIYQVYATWGAFYIPLIVMLVLYGRILMLARHMAQADAKQKLVTESVTKSSTFNHTQYNAHSSLESDNNNEQFKTEQFQRLNQSTDYKSNGQINNVQNNNSMLTKEKYPLPPSELCRRRKPRPLRRFSYHGEGNQKSSDMSTTQTVRKPRVVSESSSMLSSIEQFEQRVKELRQLRAEFFAAPYTRHSISINLAHLKNRSIHKKDENLNSVTVSDHTANYSNNNITNQPMTPMSKNDTFQLTDTNRSRNSIFSPPLLSISHYFDESSHMNSLSQISEAAPNLYTPNTVNCDKYSSNLISPEEISCNIMMSSQETTPLIVSGMGTFSTSATTVSGRRDVYSPPSSSGTPPLSTRLVATGLNQPQPPTMSMHVARPRQRPFHTPRRSFTTANEYLHKNRPFLLGLPDYTIDRRCSTPSTSHNFPWNQITGRHVRKDVQRSLGQMTNTRTTTTTTTMTNDNNNNNSNVDNHGNITRASNTLQRKKSSDYDQISNFNVTSHLGSRTPSWAFAKLPVKKRHSRHQNESKAVKTLGVIMGCFCLCWLPFFIIALVDPIIKVTTGRNLEVPDVVRSIFLWLGYFNSTINPVIYVIFNRDFRLPFREILLCRCRGINARLRSQKYALEYGVATSNASGGGVAGGGGGGGGPPLINNENNNNSSLAGIGGVSGSISLQNKRRSQINTCNSNNNNGSYFDRLRSHTNLGYRQSTQIDNLNLPTGRYNRRQSGSVSFYR
uniref:G-protein coupled receptors family 1 profile domain-containing protein n=1 Tax=Trichobilharzia regenti TaxID=157069 RepID=A0AA85K848_TRIRE|nr:unnamed protein product [Trichobilharzia regenti]